MMGIEQGAVVVSEPCLTLPGIDPGRHYLQVRWTRRAEVLSRLLGSSDGDAFAHQASELSASELRPRFDLRHELRALAFLHAAGRSTRA